MSAITTDRIAELARDYISDMYTQSDLSDYDAFLEEQRDFFRKHSSHLSPCFTDTSVWVEGECGDDEEAEEEAQRALQAEIVRQIMEGQEW